MLPSLDFKCGTKPLLLDKLLVRRTYEGVIEGRPSDERNQAIRDRFESWVAEFTGLQKTAVIEPKVESHQGSPRLPRFSCAVFLSHPSPAHDVNAHMSSAAIIWYQQSDPLIDGLDIHRIAAELNWSDVARDGWY